VETSGRSRAPLLTWLAVLLLTSLPYALAAWRPPRGTAFRGAFVYLDDFYQYLSFIEQASRGAIPFRNKFDIEPHSPALLNLEWTAQGVLAALLGGSPITGYHALRPLALAALVFGAARLMRAGGLTGGRLSWALVLFMTGSGLGLLRDRLGAPGWHIPDLLMGIYPAHQALFNAHGALCTGLLMWTLAFHLEWRDGRRSRGWWLASAWTLGLCRPYDLIAFSLVAATLAGADLVSRNRRQRGRNALLELLWLAPVLVYYPALMAAQPSFAGWKGEVSGDLNPPLHGFVYALGPAAALALLTWTRPRAASTSGELPRALASWAGVLVVVLVGVRSPMMKQIVSSFGTVLLLLVALALPRRWLPVATLGLCPTTMFLLWKALHPAPPAFASRTDLAATAFLRSACAPEEVALAPTNLSLMIAGLTPCSVHFGFRSLTPDFPARIEEGDRFYHDPATTVEWRLDYLRRVRATWLILPTGGGSLLGEEPPYAPRLRLSGLEIWGARAPDRR
jgi:hypothetical protein